MTGLNSGRFGPFAAEAEELIAKVRRSVVLVQGHQGHGSGVIWNRSGLIITNNHVVGRGPITVELCDGRLLPAKVIARNRKNDLAALEVRESGLPAAPIGDSANLRVGELVIAVGNPFGVRGNATLGIISGVGNATWMGQADRDVIHADVALAPGNSGGPLVDATGHVIGIASMILSPGIALAVPSHVVRQFIGQIAQARAA
jgi:serine protease Do